jgi:hypothetical protein
MIFSKLNWMDFAIIAVILLIAGLLEAKGWINSNNEWIGIPLGILVISLLTWRHKDED